MSNLSLCCLFLVSSIFAGKQTQSESIFKTSSLSPAPSYSLSIEEIKKQIDEKTAALKEKKDDHLSVEISGINDQIKSLGVKISEIKSRERHCIDEKARLENGKSQSPNVQLQITNIDTEILALEKTLTHIKKKKFSIEQSLTSPTFSAYQKSVSDLTDEINKLKSQCTTAEAKSKKATVADICAKKAPARVRVNIINIITGMPVLLYLIYRCSNIDYFGNRPNVQTYDGNRPKTYDATTSESVTIDMYEGSENLPTRFKATSVRDEARKILLETRSAKITQNKKRQAAILQHTAAALWSRALLSASALPEDQASAWKEVATAKQAAVENAQDNEEHTSLLEDAAGALWHRAEVLKSANKSPEEIATAYQPEATAFQSAAAAITQDKDERALLLKDAAVALSKRAEVIQSAGTSPEEVAEAWNEASDTYQAAADLTENEEERALLLKDAAIASSKRALALTCAGQSSDDQAVELLETANTYQKAADLTKDEEKQALLLEAAAKAFWKKAKALESANKSPEEVAEVWQEAATACQLAAGSTQDKANQASLLKSVASALWSKAKALESANKSPEEVADTLLEAATAFQSAAASTIQDNEKEVLLLQDAGSALWNRAKTLQSAGKPPTEVADAWQETADAYHLAAEITRDEEKQELLLEAASKALWHRTKALESAGTSPAEVSELWQEVATTRQATESTKDKEKQVIVLSNAAQTLWTRATALRSSNKSPKEAALTYQATAVAFQSAAAITDDKEKRVGLLHNAALVFWNRAEELEKCANKSLEEVEAAWLEAAKACQVAAEEVTENNESRSMLLVNAAHALWNIVKALKSAGKLPEELAPAYQVLATAYQTAAAATEDKEIQTKLLLNAATALWHTAKAVQSANKSPKEVARGWIEAANHIN